MPKTIEVDFAIGDPATNDKGEAGTVSAIKIASDGSVSYEVEVPPEAQHIVKALAAVDAWADNVLKPSVDEKTFGQVEKLRFALRQALG